MKRSSRPPTNQHAHSVPHTPPTHYSAHFHATPASLIFPTPAPPHSTSLASPPTHTAGLQRTVCISNDAPEVTCFSFVRCCVPSAQFVLFL
ncbi:hypothetical protein E2C01_063872 [Portunus trituberculatus]|uniref:Uncharacterized protein n=1 Tax=Portunus trituberculatus TaxID=210409 RepID=A0A5B7HEV5_PORTR|nr:hypothetical protein [Portunus trituberculatus]